MPTPQEEPRAAQTPSTYAPTNTSGGSTPNSALPQKSRGRGTLIATVVALIIALALAGGVFAYMTGTISLSNPFGGLLGGAPYDTDHIARDIAAGLAQVQTTSYQFDLGVHVSERDGDIVLPPAHSSADDLVNSVQLLTMSLPKDMMLSFGFEGGIGENDAGGKDGRVAVSGSAESDDFTAKFAAEGRKVGDTFYGRITRMPSLMAEIGDIKGRWVRATMEEAKSLGYDPKDFEWMDGAESPDTEWSLREFIQLLIETIDEHDYLVVVNDPARETIDGAPAYRYDLAFNAETNDAFFDALNRKIETRYEDRFTEAELEELRSMRITKEEVAYYNQQYTYSIWARTDGTPVKFAIGGRIPLKKNVSRFSFDDSVEDDRELADEQLNTDASLTLIGVNEPLSVEAPTDSISVDEAYEILYGMTLTEQRTQSQKMMARAFLSNTVVQAKLYYDGEGSYAGFCSNDEYVSSIIDRLESETEAVQCYSSSTGFKMYTEFSDGSYRCADATGFNDTITDPTTRDVTCQ